jgi:hypothetical protein
METRSQAKLAKTASGETADNVQSDDDINLMVLYTMLREQMDLLREQKAIQLHQTEQVRDLIREINGKVDVLARRQDSLEQNQLRAERRRPK